ncbi:hypothetical protein DFH06DRAFT_1236187 [Mycena polygramma]|nr:hypothetical protein DFH06DRAFT_1236187 [Mycena polygramma]
MTRSGPALPAASFTACGAFRGPPATSVACSKPSSRILASLACRFPPTALATAHAHWVPDSADALHAVPCQSLTIFTAPAFRTQYRPLHPVHGSALRPRLLRRLAIPLRPRPALIVARPISGYMVQSDDECAGTVRPSRRVSRAVRFRRFHYLLPLFAHLPAGSRPPPAIDVLNTPP